MSAPAGGGSLAGMDSKRHAAFPSEAGRPLLTFDFGRAPKEASRAPCARPSSVKEAVLHWLEQQL